MKKSPSANSNSDLLLPSGRAPVFAAPLHVGRPNVASAERFYERMNGVFDRRQLTNHGPLVHEFEERIAKFLGVRHCIAMANATLALEIAIRAMGLRGEVIVPSFTFIATAHVLQWQRITPVFCDIAPGSHHIDPNQIERLITPKTSGILAVHTWGEPCNIDALTDISEQHGLPLLFDAAHAFGCSYDGRMIGNFGQAEVFSFHATKFINCFEGGAVTTNDDELAEKIRLMMNFGFSDYDTVVSCGTNAKMHEASAAMGLTNLEAIDEFVAVNQRNLDLYHEQLGSIPGISVFTYHANESERRNYQYVILEIDAEKAGLSRDRLMEILWAENVRARRYFFPGCHNAEPYRSLYPHADLLLPHTNELCRDVLLLPTGTSVDRQIVLAVCGIIRAAVGRGEVQL